MLLLSLVLGLVLTLLGHQLVVKVFVRGVLQLGLLRAHTLSARCALPPLLQCLHLRLELVLLGRILQHHGVVLAQVVLLALGRDD